MIPENFAPSRDRAIAPGREGNQASSQLDPMRIAMGLEYDGMAFHGWQLQDEARTIQAVVEAAVAGRPVGNGSSMRLHPVAANS